jgi:hypothetical protein
MVDEEEVSTGFEVVDYPTGGGPSSLDEADLIFAALKAGKTPTEIAAFMGTTSDQVVRVASPTSAASSSPVVGSSSLRRPYVIASPTAATVAGSSALRHPYPMFAASRSADEMSIVSSVTEHVKSIASAYSNECSVFTEMYDESNEGPTTTAADENNMYTAREENNGASDDVAWIDSIDSTLTDADLVSINSAPVLSKTSTIDNRRQQPVPRNLPQRQLSAPALLKRNRFNGRKFAKKLSILPGVSEIDNDEQSLTPIEIVSSYLQKKRDRVAKQVLKIRSPRSSSHNGGGFFNSSMEEEKKKMSSSNRERTPSDDSTAASSTQTSSHTSSQVSSIETAISSMNSTITISTADFDDNASNLSDLAFQSFLTTTTWEAAKRGDYATLNYIATRYDNNVWTQPDVDGNVPLYYACVNGSHFGKYGVESVKLLIDVWPGGSTEIPNDLLKCCLKETTNTAVKNELKKVMGKTTFLVNSSRKEVAKLLESTDSVTPKSFLDDLGDDGYVEDY